MIGTRGMIRLRTEAASIPFMRGVARSRIIRSGFRAFAFSMASMPSAASPQTWKPRFSRKVRMTSRTASPSSISKTLPGVEAGMGVGLGRLRHGDLTAAETLLSDVICSRTEFSGLEMKIGYDADRGSMKDDIVGWKAFRQVQDSGFGGVNVGYGVDPDSVAASISSQDVIHSSLHVDPCES